jgi:predicted alpha/beta-fold hydrolase
MQNFQPPKSLRNAHTQTFLGASAFRRLAVYKRSRQLLKNSTSIILRCTDGVRLQAEFSHNSNSNNQLAVLLHGWEGSAHSAYTVGCAKVFYSLGYHVARLNLRDHGDTHHLNQTPFNSVNIDEVADAILDLARRHPNQGVVLLGFSLGGNFVLRLAGLPALKEYIKHSIAICPAVNPQDTSETLEKGNWYYHYHFLHKWRDSLAKKYRYYPEIMRSPADLKVKKLHQMNQLFVPLHTEFDKPEDYLQAYRIDQDTLNAIQQPCDIIYSIDDPIIGAYNYNSLSNTTNVSIYAQQYGGHCAFLENLQLDSWIDHTLPDLLKRSHSS